MVLLCNGRLLFMEFISASLIRNLSFEDTRFQTVRLNYTWQNV